MSSTLRGHIYVIMRNRIQCKHPSITEIERFGKPLFWFYFELSLDYSIHIQFTNYSFIQYYMTDLLVMKKYTHIELSKVYYFHCEIVYVNTC